MSLLAALVGCESKPLTPEGQALLDEGIAAYDAEDYDQARDRLDVFMAAHGDRRGADEAFYYRGLAHYQMGHPERAKVDFATAIDRSSRSDLKALARLALGVIAYDQGDAPAAERHLRRSLKGLDESQPPTDRAMYYLGASLQRQNRWEEADVYFNRLIWTFPDSPQTPEAKRRVHGRHWTIQVGAFTDLTNAEQLVEKLKADGHPAFLWPKHVDRRLHYFVRIGRWRSYSRAASQLAEIKVLHEGAFLTVVPLPIAVGP
jgi:tetratricopeptide (TPR) repeat protein